MATMLGVRRQRSLRAGVAAVLMAAVAVVLIVSWAVTPVSVHAADQPATPSNESADEHPWGTTGCFVPGAAIDVVPGLFNFRHACIHHGGCYQGLDRVGDSAMIDRRSCDQLFRTDLGASCTEVHGGAQNWRSRECESTAAAYLAVVRSFGASYYTGSGDPS
jgi:Prokaryotic phospholipase A2